MHGRAQMPEAAVAKRASLSPRPAGGKDVASIRGRQSKCRPAEGEQRREKNGERLMVGVDECIIEREALAQVPARSWTWTCGGGEGESPQTAKSQAAGERGGK